MADADRAYRTYQDINPDWAWRFRVLKAEIFVWRGLSKDSLALLEDGPPVALGTDPVAVRRLITQGVASCFLQRFDPASNYLREAEQLSRKAQPSLLGEVALAEGTASILQNKYESARASFEIALQIARNQKDKFLEANALGSLGLTYMRMHQYDQALDWLSASLELSRHLGSRSQVSKTLGNIGWAYYKLGDFDRALSLFTTAADGAAQLGLAKDRFLWLTNIGNVHYERREYGDAASYYEKAFGIARELENKQGQAACLNNLAVIALDQKQYQAAEDYNQRAFRVLLAGADRTSVLRAAINEGRIAVGRHEFDKAAVKFLGVFRGAGDDLSIRWEAQANLAEIYAATKQSEKAERAFLKAIATIDQGRASLSKEEHRLPFLATAGQFYNEYLDYLVPRGRLTEALAVAEHSRARTLAEGLGLSSKISSQHLYPASDAQAQAVARQSNAVILYYWLKPERSYLWAITPQTLALFSLPGQDEIDAVVQAWRKALVGPRDPLQASNPAGQKLYEMLVAPAQKLLRAGSRIVIVADGSLHGLNFETLLAPGPRPHYWIEDVEISNANSLELLAASERKRQASGRGLLLIGDPLTAGTEFPPLARAEDEVQRVEAHFDGNGRVTFTRDQATATAYRDSQPGRFAYIHFVAHGTSSRISPLDSAVVLSKEGDAYKLYARDIVQQPLHANLVTISACYGAGERAYTGEGLVGLSWAFLRAGAHNVIGALWEVNDISTPQLMDTMYTDLQKGHDPATALRAAKLIMLHSDSVFRRPFYWAPFQLYVGS